MAALSLTLVVLSLCGSTQALAAGPWVVKDAAGKRVGYAKTNGSAYSLAKHRVYGPERILRAWVQYDRMFAWTTYCRARSGRQAAAYVQRMGSSGWHMGTVEYFDPPKWSGRVNKRGGRWVVYATVDGVRRARGSVTAKCPAWLAGGAVYILLGDRW
jgi:hypothetical protein